MDNLLIELGLIIVVASIGAYLANILKQPLIPVYIILGVLLGPVLTVITNNDIILALSEIGVTFLLFIVGLELDFKKLVNIGAVASIGTLAQFSFLYAIGFLVSALMGYTPIESAYLAIIIVFSSTMVVIKLLSDKKELDTLHGRIVIGVLLMQDLLAIISLSILSTLNEFSPLALAMSLLTGAGLIIFAFILSKYIFPIIFKSAAKNSEVLFLLSISISFIFGYLFFLLGFSLAIGAFIAGVALGNLPYNLEISSRVHPLKDFFGVLFFVSLGMLVETENIMNLIKPVLVLLGIILILKTIFNLMLFGAFRYEKRTAFISSIYLAQVSEFALIIVGAGVTAGAIGQEFLTITILLAIITIGISSYMIKYALPIYEVFHPLLSSFRLFRNTERELDFIKENKVHETIMIGCDRVGTNIFKTLYRKEKNILIVDFNPEIVKKFARKGISCVYGDISDFELLEKINLQDAKKVISTIPILNDNKRLIELVKKKNPDALVIVTAYVIDDAVELYKEGADYVIVPHLLGGHYASVLLKEVDNHPGKMKSKRDDHIKELTLRKSGNFQF